MAIIRTPPGGSMSTAQGTLRSAPLPTPTIPNARSSIVTTTDGYLGNPNDVSCYATPVLRPRLAKPEAMAATATHSASPIVRNCVAGAAVRSSVIVANGAKIPYGTGQIYRVDTFPDAAAGLTVFAWLKLDSAAGLHNTLELCTGDYPAPDSKYSIKAEVGFLKLRAAFEGDYTIAPYAYNTAGWVFVIIKFTNASTVSAGVITTPGGAITWGVVNLSTTTATFTEFNLGLSTGGSLQYVGMMASAMSDAALIAQSSKTVFPTGAWLFWDLNEGSTADSSGNGRDGTAVSTTASISSPLTSKTYSGPAVTFASKALPASGDWQALATDGAGMWVAVQTFGIPAYSTDGGETWLSCNSTNITSQPWCLCAYGLVGGNPLWIIVAGSTGGAQDQYLTSSNGINWTARTLPVAATWYTFAFGPTSGKFILAAFVDADSYNTTDGINWNSVPLNEGHHWQDTIEVGSRWVIEGTGPFEQVSDDGGATWAELGWGDDGVAIGHQTWVGIANLGGTWVSPCSETDYAGYATSQNGTAWEYQTWPLTGVGARAIAASATKIIVVPGTGSVAAQTVDGVNWCNVTLPFSGTYSVIKSGGGKWVALASGSAYAAVGVDDTNPATVCTLTPVLRWSVISAISVASGSVAATVVNPATVSRSVGPTGLSGTSAQSSAARSRFLGPLAGGLTFGESPVGRSGISGPTALTVQATPTPSSILRATGATPTLVLGATTPGLTTRYVSQMAIALGAAQAGTARLVNVPTPGVVAGSVASCVASPTAAQRAVGASVVGGSTALASSVRLLANGQAGGAAAAAIAPANKSRTPGPTVGFVQCSAVGSNVGRSVTAPGLSESMTPTSSVRALSVGSPVTIAGAVASCVVNPAATQRAVGTQTVAVTTAVGSGVRGPVVGQVSGTVTASMSSASEVRSVGSPTTTAGSVAACVVGSATTVRAVGATTGSIGATVVGAATQRAAGTQSNAMTPTIGSANRAGIMPSESIAVSTGLSSAKTAPAVSSTATMTVFAWWPVQIQRATGGIITSAGAVVSVVVSSAGRQRSVGAVGTAGTSIATMVSVVQARSVGGFGVSVAWSVAPTVRQRATGVETGGATSSPTSASRSRWAGIEQGFLSWSAVPIVLLRASTSPVAGVGILPSATGRVRTTSPTGAGAAINPVASGRQRATTAVVLSSTSFATAAPVSRGRAVGPVAAALSWVIQATSATVFRSVSSPVVIHTTTNPVPIPWSITGSPIQFVAIVGEPAELVEIEGRPSVWVSITGRLTR